MESKLRKIPGFEKNLSVEIGFTYEVQIIKIRITWTTKHQFKDFQTVGKS